MQKPIKISEKNVFDSRFRKIISKSFSIKNNQIHDYFITTQWDKHKAWTMVFALTRSWEIIYTKEFRYWVEEWIINFPVWVWEDDLTAEENIKKELLEETGYTYDWKLKNLWDTIVWNYDDTKILHFLARDCYETSNPKPEDWEYIEVHKTSIENFEKMIISWKVKCPLTISCFYLWKSKAR